MSNEISGTWDVEEEKKTILSSRIKSTETEELGIGFILQEVEKIQEDVENLKNSRLIRFKRYKEESSSFNSYYYFIEQLILKKQEHIPELIDFDIRIYKQDNLIIISYDLKNDLVLESERSIAELEVLILERISDTTVEFERRYKR